MVSIACSGLTSERTSRITCSNDFSDFEAGVTVNAWMIAATKTGNPVRERCEFDKLASRMTSSVAIDLSHHGKGRENAKAQLADLKDLIQRIGSGHALELIGIGAGVEPGPEIDA